MKRDNRYPSFNILLVDDEAPWLRTLSMTLEGQGGISRLLTCQDATEVPALLAREDVGLVLLDMTMPKVSGFKGLAQMKEDYPDEKYGLATLCGGFGNSNAVLIEKVK